MTEDEARKVELVRAVELEDREAALLTREDREQADHRARAATGSRSGRRAQRAFLASLIERSRWPGWLSVAIPLLALVAGALANEFGTDKRMDVIAAPLIGTLAWNLIVYFWIVVALVMQAARRNRQVGDPLVGMLARIGRARGADPDLGTAVERAAAVFRNRWASLTAPLAMARASRTLHLGAALFAVGLIGGIYARALVIEYSAGWESTFLGAEAVRAILTTVLGPASAVSGLAIPSLDEIAAMRWTGAETGGVNAAPWIHLYMLTVAGLVIVPRLLLAIWQGLRARHLARNLPVASRDDFYVRRVLRASGAKPGKARVTPYAYRPGEETIRRLTATLRTALGDGAEIRVDPPVDYGGEDDWLAAHKLDPDDDYHLLLFTLSSTPEDENHGRFAEALAGKDGRAGKGTVVGALIDESAYRAHFAGQAGIDERIETRLASWRRVLAPVGIMPVSLDLSEADSLAMAQRIEAGLIPTAELQR